MRNLFHAAAPALLGLVGACVAPTRPPPTPLPPARAPVAVQVPLVVPPGAVPRPPAALAATIESLGRNFDGRAAIAVRDVQAGWVVSFNGAALCPQQSVSKLWVAITFLDAVDRGSASLDEPITVRRSDLTLFHQPIRAMIGPDGFTTSYRDLLTRAMTESDNTANDLLLKRAGGPIAVRAMLARGGITGVGFGPGEKLLQSRTAGLEWRDDWAGGAGFEQARAALPVATRMAALERYLADPPDGASPEGVTLGLSRLRKGLLLSPSSTSLLLSLMAEAHTGPLRVKAGVAPGWAYAHKTGTGQELGGFATGYNDVGLITSPDGRSYAIAVMIASTRQPIPVRQRLMADVARIVVAQEGMPQYAAPYLPPPIRDRVIDRIGQTPSPHIPA